VITRKAPPLGEEGFTLIEVLAAMVILAVGLLALEALGIGAARTLALAESGNELVAAGTTAMENAQQRVRRELSAPPPSAVTTGESCEPQPPSLTVCTDVQTRASLGAIPSKNARVTVTVTTTRTGTVPFSITSYVFDPALP
jgi:prepilin-type N-terminal cleavage/methylation domain-containing protein